MLRVRGDSMIDAGILDGDFVVARAQTTADKGDIVVAGIPGDEATVKTYSTARATRSCCCPANERLDAHGVRPPTRSSSSARSSR